MATFSATAAAAGRTFFHVMNSHDDYTKGGSGNLVSYTSTANTYNLTDDGLGEDSIVKFALPDGSLVEQFKHSAEKAA